MSSPRDRHPFVEETDPGRILEATLGKLRDGLPVKTLLTASALAIPYGKNMEVYEEAVELLHA